MENAVENEWPGHEHWWFSVGKKVGINQKGTVLSAVTSGVRASHLNLVKIVSYYILISVGV